MPRKVLSVKTEISEFLHVARKDRKPFEMDIRGLQAGIDASCERSLIISTVVIMRESRGTG